MAKGWTPDPRPRIQRAQRFFARPESFTLECPSCGIIYRVRVAGKGSILACWDPVTARFTCTRGCSKVYVIGLLAWPVKPQHRVATQTPEDQVPSPRQLAQLRKEGGGWWLGEQDAITLKRPQETNLTLEAERPEDEDED